MATYRDGDPRFRIDTLEAKLAERDASLAARDAELAELRAELAQLGFESGFGRRSRLAPWLAVGAVITAVALAVACVGLHFETGRVRSVAAAEEARLRAARLDVEKRFDEHRRPAPAAAALPLDAPLSSMRFGDETTRAVLSQALDDAARDASRCGQPGGPTGTGAVILVFDPLQGVVDSASIDGAPFAGSSVQPCVEESFRRVRTGAFKAARLTLARSFTIP